MRTFAGALTVLTTGVARYATVLRLRRGELSEVEGKRLIEQATALGFFIGAAASAVIIVVDTVVA